MLKFVVLVAFIGLAGAQRLQQRTQDITLVRSEAENNGDGTFRWNYETSDGSRQDQSGYIKNPQALQDDQIQVIQGSYSYYTPEGVPVQISYTADENGYQAQGDAIPTSPPIPEAIQKSLDIIYRNVKSQQAAAPQQQFRPQQPFRPVNTPPRRF